MNTQRNSEQTIRRTLGRTLAAAAITAIAMTSFSAQANDNLDGYSTYKQDYSEFKIKQRRAPANVGFNFSLGGSAGFGKSDYYFRDQQQQFERSSTVDQPKVNPFDNGSDNAFGSRLNYDKPIYRSNNSNFRNSFGSVGQ